ncbi:TPA: TIGR02253 family HAD-type hydrolase [Candidatus Woesearchaeota archaeon]|nr:TIGR02253 family HAD-type hydrolase [Candidatus Woesearchaeota archaeon]HIH43266.1 TIGR02253 family HAD-type hydrolase [Candidatus Woesearchaeota archaeon]
MIKAILFDLDNTLIDFLKMKRMAIEEAVEAMIDAGLKLDKKQAVELIYELYKEKGMEDQEIFQKFLLRSTGKVEIRIIAKAILAYRRVRDGYLAPYPRVRETLHELKMKRYKLGIVTDAPQLNAWMRLCSMHIDHLFDVVVTFDDTKECKPSGLPFQKALEKLELSAGECLMVGDWPERDIAGAKAVGMKACFAKYGCARTIENHGADFVLHSFEELLEIIGKEKL